MMEQNSKSVFENPVQQQKFIEMTQAAGNTFATHKVVGISSDKTVQIQMNCAYQQFQIQIHPGTLKQSAQLLEQRISEAYQDALQKIQKLFVQHSESYINQLNSQLGKGSY